MPVSPPPYLNDGGPRELLSSVIETKFPFVDPAAVASILEERLPNPLDDIEKWLENDEGEEF
jgi:hypothetical protein